MIAPATPVWPDPGTPAPTVAKVGGPQRTEKDRESCRRPRPRVPKSPANHPRITRQAPTTHSPAPGIAEDVGTRQNRWRFARGHAIADRGGPHRSVVQSVNRAAIHPSTRSPIQQLRRSVRRLTRVRSTPGTDAGSELRRRHGASALERTVSRRRAAGSAPRPESGPKS